MQIIAERKLYHEQTNGQYLKSFDNDTSAKEDDAKNDWKYVYNQKIFFKFDIIL